MLESWEPFLCTLFWQPLSLDPFGALVTNHAHAVANRRQAMVAWPCLVLSLRSLPAAIQKSNILGHSACELACRPGELNRRPHAANSHVLLHVQAAAGETWVLVDSSILAAMLIWLITYSVYIRTLVSLQPQNTYEVYDSLGGAQARLLLPKKQERAASDGTPGTLFTTRQLPF